MNVLITVKNCYLSKIEAVSWIEKTFEWGKEVSKILTKVRLRFTNGDSASAVFNKLKATDIFELFYNEDYSHITSKELYDLMLNTFSVEQSSTYSDDFYYHYS